MDSGHGEATEHTSLVNGDYEPPQVSWKHKAASRVPMFCGIFITAGIIITMLIFIILLYIQSFQPPRTTQDFQVAASQSIEAGTIVSVGSDGNLYTGYGVTYTSGIFSQLGTYRPSGCMGSNISSTAFLSVCINPEDFSQLDAFWVNVLPDGTTEQDGLAVVWTFNQTIQPLLSVEVLSPSSFVVIYSTPQGAVMGIAGTLDPTASSSITFNSVPYLILEQNVQNEDITAVTEALTDDSFLMTFNSQETFMCAIGIITVNVGTNSWAITWGNNTPELTCNALALAVINNTMIVVAGDAAVAVAVISWSPVGIALYGPFSLGVETPNPSYLAATAVTGAYFAVVYSVDATVQGVPQNYAAAVLGSVLTQNQQLTVSFQSPQIFTTPSSGSLSVSMLPISSALLISYTATGSDTSIVLANLVEQRSGAGSTLVLTFVYPFNAAQIAQHLIIGGLSVFSLNNSRLVCLYGGAGVPVQTITAYGGLRALGVASSTAAANKKVSVTMAGTSSAHEGMQAGTLYYAHNDGTISSVTGGSLLGVALSPNELLLSNNFLWQATPIDTLTNANSPAAGGPNPASYRQYSSLPRRHNEL